MQSDAGALEQRIQTVCLLILATAAAGACLFWLRPALLPFVLALFIALGLTPLVDFQVERLRLPRGLAVAATGLIALLLIWLLGSLLSTSIGQLAENANRYQTQVDALLTTASQPLERFGVSLPEALGAGGVSAGAIGGALLGTTTAVLDALSKSLLVLIFVIYLLIGGSAPQTGVAREIVQRVQRYIVTKGLMSGATGLLVGLTLWILDVDLALVFGVLALLLNFMPSVGSIVATLLPLPIVLVSPDVSATAAVLAIAVPAALQFAIGSVIEPKLMGDSLDLHPIAILIALIFWGMLWGVIGMLLATPITAVLRILFERLEYTRPLANLLAGRLSAN